MSNAAPPPEADPSPRPWEEGRASFAAAFGATDEELDLIRRYLVMLEQANGWMNLVGPSAFADIWTRHVLDSAQLFHMEQSRTAWVDIGSGAGFPGVILAILLRRRIGGRIDLVESMAKRAQFLREVCAALDLPAVVHTVRAETWKPPAPIQVVTARACAPLPRLLQFTAHLMRPGVVGLFLKGRDVERELADARKVWRFRAETTPSLSGSDGRVLRIEGVSRLGR